MLGNSQKYKQSGNAIVIIFVAIGLFAALAYVFSQSSRTSSGFISDSDVSARADAILSYGSQIKSAYKRLEIRGCDFMEISFENPIEAGYTNGNAPTSNKCHLFEPAGGNLKYNRLNGETIRFTDRHSLENIGCTGASLCTELLFTLKDISQNLCEALNKKLGIIGIPSDTNGAAGLMKFDGSFLGVGTEIGDSDANLAGQAIACYEDSDDSEYIFYYNLAPR